MGTKKIFLGLLIILFSFEVQSQCSATDSWEWPGHRNWFTANPIGWTGMVTDMTTFTTTSVGTVGGVGSPGGAIQSYEGVSAVSDDNGNLLWYTNGRKLWTGTGAGATLMYSGLLAGNEDGATGFNGSAVQGIMVLKHPLSPGVYYIFTSDDANSGTKNGLNYWTVDAGGNVLSGPTRLGAFTTTEGIAVTRHANGIDLWIGVMESGNTGLFDAYLLTCAGIDIAGSNLSQPGAPAVSGQQDRGAVAFSWDGSRLAQAHPNGWPTADQQVSVYDFDNATGAITNAMHIAPTAVVLAPYDLVFSPDNSRLYISRQSAGIDYFDLSSGVAATITASRSATGIGTGYSALEIGPGPVLYTTTGTNASAIRAITPTSGDLNTSTTFTVADIPGTSGNARSGLPIMYIPPTDVPEIGDPGALCDTDPPVDLATTFACLGNDAEVLAHTYSGPGITDANLGTFDPSIAGVGVHQIIFSLAGTCNAIDDTLMITVTSCGCGNIDPDLGLDVTICDDQTVTLDAGAGYASYQWVENGVIMVGQTGQTITADSGTYVVNVTDLGACNGTDTIEISNWQLPVVDLGPDTFYCATDSFLLDAGVFAGYAWTPNGESSQTIYATAAGTYGVTVTDGNGCENTATVDITERALPVPTISGNTIVCQDSTTLITGTAGSGGSLAWSGITPFVNPLPVTAAGTYTLIETDASGCIDSVDYTLTLEALPAVELGGPYTFCFSQGNQLLDASTGAVGETYLWSDASSDPTLNITDSSIVSVIVTSANGCIAYDTAVIDTFSLPVIDLGPDTFYCATDSFLLDAGVFAGYAWTPNGETSQTIYAAAAGTYGVTVTDGNGCENTATVDITERALPVPTISGNTIVCEDSTTLITGAAGSGGSLAWSGITPFVNPLPVTAAGTYTLIETDASGCIDSVDYTLTLEALPAVELGGPYTFCFSQGNQLLDASTGAVGETYLWSDASSDPTLTVTDSSIVSVIVTSANGCIAYDTAIVDTFSLPVVDLGPDTFYCALDSILLDAGAGYVNYAWTPNSETSQTIFAKSAATYGVTVTDVNGCTDAASVNITENALPIVDLGPDTTICEADSITLDATHPTAASYSWTPGLEVSATIKVGSVPGTYEVTVTDVDGCVFTIDRTISEESLPIVDLGENDTICDDLTKTLDAGAGYNYAWYLDGSILGAETSQTLDADSGTYVVSVTTALGCETRDTILVDNHQLPVVNLNGPFEYCELDSVQLDASNNTASYVWSPTNETTQTIWAKIPATYTVTVTDTNGCINSGSSVVVENANPIVDLGANDSACVGLVIPLSATIPNGVTYLWSNGHALEDYTLIGPDTLSVIATDSKGCIGYDTIEIAALDSLVFALGDTTIECENAINSLDAGSFQGGSYSWELPNGSTVAQQIIKPLESGWYKVNVTDVFNCKGLDSIYVQIIPQPNMDIGSGGKFCSLGQETFTLKMNFKEKYEGTITWSEDNNNSNDTLFTATYAPALIIGTFTDDKYGCTDTATAYLEEYCEPTIIKLPNIFVPGGTNNTTFHPIDLNDDNYEEIVNNIVSSDFEVFNRWGLKVFQSADLLPRWDGMFENRPVASGTYFWIYKYKDSSLKEYTLNGFVQVVQLRD